jgi:hypothetical protein
MPRRHWGGNFVKHPASITYRKLSLPVVVATTCAKQAFNLTHSSAQRTLRHRSTRDRQDALRQRLRELAAVRVR